MENVYKEYDNASLNSKRRYALFMGALGEFIDGYDLIVIGAALLLLKPAFHLTATYVGLLGATAFIGAGVGLFIFGFIVDFQGRRKVYSYNLILFVILAIVAAFVINSIELIIVRFLMGFVIGVDIAASMTYLAEVSTRKSRGAYTGALPQITWTFGALASIIIGLVLLITVGPVAWRWMFGIAAIPSLIVFIGRQFIPESPRWLIIKGRYKEAKMSFEELTGVKITDTQVAELSNIMKSSRPKFREIFRKDYRKKVIIAYIIVILTPLTGGLASVIEPYVFSSIGLVGNVGSLVDSSFTWIAGLFGAITAFYLLDKIGRFKIVAISTLGSFIVGLSIAFTISSHNPALFVPLFVILGFLTWFGASAFWLLPTEMVPTELRGKSQGIAQGFTRLVVAATTFIVAYGSVTIGFTATIIIISATGGLFVGIVAILSMRSMEPMKKSLENISSEVID